MKTYVKILLKDFLGVTVDKNLPASCRRHGFNPRSGKIPHATKQLSLCIITTESVLQFKRSHGKEKPKYRNYRLALARCN